MKQKKLKHEIYGNYLLNHDNTTLKNVQSTISSQSVF